MSDHDHRDTDLTDQHGEAEALRCENARLRAEIAEATDPEFIWGAMDNVHDCDTTLDDYAAAVSRAQRAALAASRAPDPVANAGSCQTGDLISRAAAIKVAVSIAERQCPDNMPHDAYMAYHSGAMDVLDAIRAIPAAHEAEVRDECFALGWKAAIEAAADEAFASTHDGEYVARAIRSTPMPSDASAALTSLTEQARAQGIREAAELVRPQRNSIAATGEEFANAILARAEEIEKESRNG